MNRRKFLQTTGITLAGVLIPIIGNSKPVTNEDPTTVDELIEAMENRFVCSVGYPGPYIFKVDMTASEFLTHDIVPNVNDKFRYITYGLRGYKDHPRGVEQALVRSFWAMFRQYPQGASLYWRLPEKIQLEDYEYVMADGWTPNGVMMTKIRTRLVFPDYYKG